MKHANVVCRDSKLLKKPHYWNNDKDFKIEFLGRYPHCFNYFTQIASFP